MNNKLVLIFIFILSSIYGFSQTGKVLGKLDLQDFQNKKAVSEKTYVILKTKNKIDSVKVDSNLEFIFDNVEADTVRISFFPYSYPINRHYIFKLADGESKSLNLLYSSTCPYSKSETKLKCPTCHKKDKVIPIVYGLGAEIGYEYRNGKFITSKKNKSKAGGCIVSDCQPNWFCERDNLEF